MKVNMWEVTQMTLEEAIMKLDLIASDAFEGGNADEFRQLAEWLRELKRDRKILDGLSIYFQSLVVDAVINQRPLMFDMRDATKEERESVKQYIADSAKTTGVNFWSIIGEVNADGINRSDYESNK